MSISKKLEYEVVQVSVWETDIDLAETTSGHDNGYVDGDEFWS